MSGKLAVNGGTPAGRINAPWWPIYKADDMNIISDSFMSGRWGYNGPLEGKFSEQLSGFFNGAYVVLVTNGTHALQLSLEALEIGPGDEVIVPGITWQATASACLAVNAVPVIVDISEKDFNISADAIRNAITPQTKCIIPVHLYGRICNMDKILEIAKEYNLKIIEDSSHQHGSVWKTDKTGTIGDIGIFSMQASKPLNTGEGGIIVTKDERLYYILQSLKNCGKAYKSGGLSMHSGNYRITEMQCAVGISQLSRLPEQIQKRDENAKYLEQLLTGIEGMDSLERNPNITTQTYYHYSLYYNKEYWCGLDREKLKKAIEAELDWSVQLQSSYEPLNRTDLYNPLNKKTHRLNPEYIERIDPSKINLPVSRRIYEENYLGLFHNFLLAERTDMELFADALMKIKKNVHELTPRSKNN